ncbi:hypothetical protein DPMN_087319 [Dreissena polymorpha]|uniref:Uncharacterized protein n=1 Tax=Dreissena polymorpha TaxID=45954 RepID=A0A9D4KSK5_DREPO|nr:hypothetical protein DPMN_087319 [Dreissena polymorpha]
MPSTASGTMFMPATILTGYFIKERHPRKTKVQHMTILQELPKVCYPLKKSKHSSGK